MFIIDNEDIREKFKDIFKQKYFIGKLNIINIFYKLINRYSKNILSIEVNYNKKKRKYSCIMEKYYNIIKLLSI